jgi:hypothetical protein
MILLIKKIYSSKSKMEQNIKKSDSTDFNK